MRAWESLFEPVDVCSAVGSCQDVLRGPYAGHDVGDLV